MTRRTKTDLLDLERIINRALTDYGYFWSVSVEWAYGKPRAYMLDENGYQQKELSPRLRTGLLYDWLSAWYSGLCWGLMEKEEEV